VQRALAILEPQLSGQAEDRATVLSTVRARLLLAATTGDRETATELRERALRTTQAQSSGADDPRLLALQVEALLALGREHEAQRVLPKLWNTGYRDPALIALLHQPHTTMPSSTRQERAASTLP
jgi:hypothetical protein